MKKEYPPISPLMVSIKEILDKNLDAPRDGIVTGKTVSAAKIEQLFKEKYQFKEYDNGPKPDFFKYSDLKNGEIYVTDYPNQGIYIFQQGYPLWLNKKGEIGFVHKITHNFTPGNGFHNFKLASVEEIKQLLG